MFPLVNSISHLTLPPPLEIDTAASILFLKLLLFIQVQLSLKLLRHFVLKTFSLPINRKFWKTCYFLLWRSACTALLFISFYQRFMMKTNASYSVEDRGTDRLNISECTLKDLLNDIWHAHQSGKISWPWGKKFSIPPKYIFMHPRHLGMHISIDS